MPLAFIPSPHNGVIHIGPVPLHAYGLMLALGVVVAARVAETRWARTGRDPKVIAQVAVPIVIAGVIGARVYHLFTGYKWSERGIAGAFEIWRGGLSIWGAVAGGLIAAFVLSRYPRSRTVVRRGGRWFRKTIAGIRRRPFDEAPIEEPEPLDLLALMDAMAPGIVLAQAIGRWGNFFNQELFGRPTTLPWGLKIDVAHRPPGYTQYATFHPTFLYESLWCLFVFGFLLWAERRFRFRRGQTFALYVAMYTFGRIWFEALRIDDATKLFGVRFNLMLSIALCIFGFAWFAYLARRPADKKVALGPEARVP